MRCLVTELPWKCLPSAVVEVGILIVSVNNAILIQNQKTLVDSKSDPIPASMCNLYKRINGFR